MPFKKGQSGNPRGRPKKPNKATAELRSWIQALIDGNRSRLESDLLTMEARDRWTIIERLMSYCLPKMQSVDASVQFDRLTDDHIDIIVNQLLNTIQNDNT